MRTKLAVGFLLLVLLGCSRTPVGSTETGSLGEVDLASKLPAGVTVPAEVKSYDARRTICPGAKANEPLDVRVRWKTFTKDGATYIASYSVEIVKGAPGVFAKLEKDSIVQNVRDAGPRMASATATITCTSRPTSGVVFEETAVIYIRADGIASTNPAW